MLIVIGLGGNALLRRGEPHDMFRQQRRARDAARALAPLVSRHRSIVTHGNGPQVGDLALRSEAAGAGQRAPLDVLGAETQGSLGYLLEMELRNAAPGARIATVLSQVLVDREDPAFEKPTKPIGPVVTRDEAEERARSRGWQFAPDGEGFRRVVPSPEPRALLELETLRLLAKEPGVTISAGGGGVPVALGPGNELHGVEAVVDKDLSTSLLASALEADQLLLLTDVPGVYLEFDKEPRGLVRRAGAETLGRIPFAPGTMGPKVEAACRFARALEKPAVIGALDDVLRTSRGEAGTTVVPGTAAIELWEDKP